MAVDTRKKRIKAKEIWKVQSGELQMAGVSLGASATTDVTTQITTLLSTAGANASSVSLKVSANDYDTGVVVGLQVDVLDSSNGPIANPTTGNEIYGRITEAAGVYTLSLYENIAGVETTYTPTAGFTANVSVYYAFDFVSYPRDGGIRV